MVDKDYPYDHGYEKTVSATIGVLNATAEKGATHLAFKEETSKPVYLTMPDGLTAIATSLGAAHSQGNGEQVKLLMGTGHQALYFNSQHIVMLSRYLNDPSLLDAGYPFKQKPSAKGKISLLDLEPEIVAKYLYVNREIVPGAALLVIKRARNNAIVELRMSETPNDEESYRGVGEGTYNESRVELRGLESAKRPYFIGRYHEKGATGRWSLPVSILIH